MSFYFSKQSRPGFALSLGLFAFFLSFQAYAFSDIPDCLAGGQELGINNAQVISWKNSTQNQFRSRAHVRGTLRATYPDQSGHDHLQVQIGPQPNDTIEVIYNQEFGAIPETPQGIEIEACGDYITATAQAGPYPPSPDGAILHWVHKAPKGSHESGYLVVNGVVCGQETEFAPPKRKKRR